MPHRIDYSHTSPHPADAVAAAMVDEEFLRARLAQLGGPGAALLDHHLDDGGGGRYRLRQGVDRAMLPSFVSSLVSGDLVIERSETLRREAAGRYGGAVDVRIPGAPVTANGSMQVADAGGGSRLQIRADVSVPVPFLGGRIERSIGEAVEMLLAAETRFTSEWLAREQA
jgi:hypothetical protein